MDKSSINNVSYEVLQGDAVKIILDDSYTDIVAFAHCCNTQGVMRSGIAKQVSEEIPEAYRAYKRSALKLGTSPYCILENGKFIFNLIAQEFYGYDGKKYIDYTYLKNSIIAMCEALVKYINVEGRMTYNQKCTVVIPFNFGSDRAGGDWTIIVNMFSNILYHYNLSLLVINYDGDL